MMARNIISGARSPIVVVLGATGAGKSKLALEIAAKYNGEIISADSMQIYKRLDIITNKVTAAEQKVCPHHMLDFVDPLTSNYTVVNFRNTALPIIDDIFSRNRLPIVVGGTNYYIESLIWKLLVDISMTKEAKRGDSVLPPGECSGKQDIPQPSGECSENHSSGSDLPPGECDGHASNELRFTKDAKEMEKLPKKTTAELHQLLLEVDEERGKKVHPNDRRKILRSLEVYYRDGCRMSSYLQDQHREAGAEAGSGIGGEGGVSGPLRFPDTCIIWVQAQQAVLDERTDRRVDEMIKQGLIQEMSDFHREYNQARLTDNREADYTTGIFQSIGFKEFHEYLIMSAEERDTEAGKAALAKGIEDMKRATRQYARKQNKWIVNRFLKRRGSVVPSVYAVDSTDPSQWQSKVHEPAVQIVDAFIQGTKSPIDPLPFQENQNLPVYQKCDVCDVVLLTSQQWQYHLNGRRHKKNMDRKRRLEKCEAGLKNSQKTLDSSHDIPNKKFRH